MWTPTRCALTRLSLRQPAADADAGYPINWMRNQGISCVRTTHYFVVDVDFWPSVGLRAAVEAQIDGWGERKRALVVPNFQRNGHGCRNDANHAACREAYEGHSSNNKLSMPETFSELLECERNTECIVFDGEYNPTGQSSTDIKAWRKLGGGEAMAVTCLKSGRYEPFVVLRKSDETPKFDERFHGYGKNKVQLLVHLRLAGFGFEVVGKGYLLHFPHPKSASKDRWLHSSAHQQVERLFSKWLREVTKAHEGVPQLSPLCNELDRRRGRQALGAADDPARLGGPVLAAAGRERPLLRPEPGGDGAAPVLHIDPRFLGGARRP